jgi:NTP pyrophosphatase (non-canonical NTP hydrolase)
MKTISQYTEQIRDWSNRKGWWDAAPAPTLFDKLFLVQGEICEAGEEFRVHGMDPDKFIYYADGKPEGIAVELADALIRLLDLCGHWNIPLIDAMEIKMAFNETRPYRHGNKLA